MAELEGSSPPILPEAQPVGVSCPIAGIGASAGGLAATSELLRHLGPRPGIGVVVIHHLDPTHESSLVEIFSRATSLPVRSVSDGTAVEPNHVYVVPPNAGLLASGGRLKLTARSEGGGLHLPIDRFLESLADDGQERPLAVILSGSGSDGSAGIRAVKAAAGVTFAQDASAEYRSMPDSAIATGCVDFVLPPAAIGEELARIGQLPPAAPAREDVAEPDGPELRRLVLALRRVSGINFANYKPGTIVRRAQRRALLQRLSSLREYVELLERDTAEANALCEEVLIHVTGFFRDPAMFEALETRVFPKLLERRDRWSPIRVWIAGCSSGEEVYSLAISLLEFLARSNAGEVPIQLFGTDVSASAIERARAGKYAEGIAQEVSPARLGSFFSRLGGGYQIRKDVRERCVFAVHDATRDPPFSGIDLISCRNLMIYLGSPLQARLLSVFHYALREAGILVLGSSETLHSSPGFVALDEKNKIFQRTAAAPRLLFDFTAPEPSERASAPALAVPKASDLLDIHREADRVVLAHAAPPGMVISDDLAIIQFRGKTAPYLEPAPGVPSLDLLRMVREELRLPLRQAIDEARSRQAAVVKQGVRLARVVPAPLIEIEVIPLTRVGVGQRYFVVLFRDVTPEETAAAGRAAPGESPGEPALVAELRQELDATRAYLESTVEQLEAGNEELTAANEEITSSNEELRSTNEELQMAKEELQATNEELRTVNDEMAVRNREATRLSDDLTNVFNSVEIPIVLLGKDTEIRRCSPAAGRAFGLAAADIGRPLGAVPRLLASAGTEMAARVLSELRPVERTLADEAGHWYQLDVRPYLTLDRRIDGTVLSAFDVDASKQSAARLAESQRYAESIIDTVSKGLLVVDAEGRVRSANRLFCQTFRLTSTAVVGRSLQELWGSPALDPLLDESGEGDSPELSRVERVMPNAETRAFLVRARRIADTPLVLLTFDDVTEREHAERALRRNELREVLTPAAEGILMIDVTGRILFTNATADALFGYGSDELLGQSVDVLVPERLRQRHAEQRLEYLADPAPRRMGRDREIVGRRKDGTSVAIEVMLSPLREEDNRIVCFVTDVTSRQASERRIVEYQERLRQMAFDAALTEERERRRIAADLHDRIGQSLALVQMKLKAALAAGNEAGPIEEAVALLAQSMADTRTLVFELSPPILYDLGLKERSRGSRKIWRNAGGSRSRSPMTMPRSRSAIRRLRWCFGRSESC